MQYCLEKYLNIFDFHQLLVVTPLRISNHVFQEYDKICSILESF